MSKAKKVLFVVLFIVFILGGITGFLIDSYITEKTIAYLVRVDQLKNQWLINRFGKVIADRIDNWSKELADGNFE